MSARETNKAGEEASQGTSAAVSQDPQTQAQSASPIPIEMPPAVSVQRLAELLDISGIEVIKQLMRRGIMANINQVIDYDTAATIAVDFGYQPQQLAAGAKSGPEAMGSNEAVPSAEEEDPSLLKPRVPVVTILGHVDHGKTTLLDTIRQTSVTASEKGGITQHIGAYQVEVEGQKITFLDTPGHEAFTAMRARGAQVTDIAVLVVAVDDGVMPQTREAIDHAKAANVSIVVAISKMDRAEANPDKVKQQLAELGLVAEDWGGDTIVVPVSAVTRDGIPQLLENILLVAEISEFKANPDRKARGVVIEAKLDTTKGALATVLVQSGTLRIGDPFLVGEASGKVRAMFDYRGQQIQEAGPSTPVEVLGIDQVPRAGDILVVVDNGKRARVSAERDRRKRGAEAGQSVDTYNIEQLMAQVRAGEAKALNVILKTDVEGSGEAIRSTLERLEKDQVKVKVLRTGSGNVTESDILLASASNAITLAFNTKAEAGAQKLADREAVQIRYYDVIYDLIKDMQSAVSGLMEPVYRDVVEGRAEVKEVFPIKGGQVAGVGVIEGKINRNALVRVMRNGDIMHESSIKSLRHFKDTVKELASGTEGGIGLEGFDDFQAGDTIEAFRKEKIESPPQ